MLSETAALEYSNHYTTKAVCDLCPLESRAVFHRRGTIFHFRLAVLILAVHIPPTCLQPWVQSHQDQAVEHNDGLTKVALSDVPCVWDVLRLSPAVTIPCVRPLNSHTNIEDTSVSTVKYGNVR